MAADEVLFIKLHDSDHSRTWRAPHTAFHDVSRPDATTRYSYEYRGFFASSRGVAEFRADEFGARHADTDHVSAL